MGGGALICMDDGRLLKWLYSVKSRMSYKKDEVGKRKSGRHALKATSGLSRSSKTGNTQPEMPRVGMKLSLPEIYDGVEEGGRREAQTPPGEEDRQIAQEPSTNVTE